MSQTASDKEEKKTKRQKAKQINLLESHWQNNRHMRILGKRNFIPKDPDATFMHMKQTLGAIKTGI